MFQIDNACVTHDDEVILAGLRLAQELSRRISLLHQVLAAEFRQQLVTRSFNQLLSLNPKFFKKELFTHFGFAVGFRNGATGFPQRASTSLPPTLGL